LGTFAGMPEEDLETAELKEHIDERLEEHEHHAHHEHHGPGKAKAPGWLRYLSLSTAMIAVFAAVASLYSGASSNEAILEKSDAMLSQSQASNQWAYYQAKSVKQKLSADEAEIVKDSRPELNARFAADARRYDAEAKQIEESARKFEERVKESNARSEQLMERHHRFAIAVTLLQIAIALSAIAALTRRRSLWFLGMAVSVGGLVVFGVGLLAA